MAKIECLKIKEITAAEHLKKFKPAQLKDVIKVFNENWFAEPVSSTTKPAMAKAIGELAIGDIEFRNKHFEDNKDASVDTLDKEITANTDHNNSLPEDISDEDYDEQCKPSPMITPDEVENGKENGLTDEVLDVIKGLTGVDYLEMYGFNVADEDIEEEVADEDPEIEEVNEEPPEESPVEEEPEAEPEKEEAKTEEKPKKAKEGDPNTKTNLNPGEMGIQVADLQEALEFVNPGLGKEENEDLVRFEKNYVRTYSSNISVLHPFETGIVGSVAGKELVALAKKLPEQDLNLSQSDSKLFIKGNQADIQFNFSTLMMPTIDIPEEGGVWHKLPKDFSEMVAVASLSCSSKARNPIYNCVVVEKDAVVACENGHRGLEVLMESEFKGGKLNIHGKLAKELIKYHPYEICIEGNSWFHFKNAFGTIVSLRQYATGEFSQAFYDNLEHKGVEVDIPGGTKKLVERSSILAGKGHRDYVTVNVSKGKMVIKGKSETGQYTEIIKLKNSDVKVEFSIHPVLFKEVLGICSYMEVCDNYILFKGNGFCCWISKTIPNN